MNAIGPDKLRCCKFHRSLLNHGQSFPYPVREELPTNQELTGVESFGHISEKPVLRPSGKLPHCPSSA